MNYRLHPLIARSRHRYNAPMHCWLRAPSAQADASCVDAVPAETEHCALPNAAQSLPLTYELENHSQEPQRKQLLRPQYEHPSFDRCIAELPEPSCSGCVPACVPDQPLPTPSVSHMLKYIHMLLALFWPCRWSLAGYPLLCSMIPQPILGSSLHISSASRCGGCRLAMVDCSLFLLVLRCSLLCLLSRYIVE